MGFVRYSNKPPGLALMEGLSIVVDATTESLIDLGFTLFSKKYRDKIAHKRAVELIYHLKHLGYIEMQKRGKKAEYTLTDKGRIKILKDKITHCKLLPKGQFVMVIFDIPESQRKLRNEFRWTLKRNKFIQVQLSVWASKQRVYKEIKDLIYELGIEKWVTIFYARDLSARLNK